MPPAHPFDDDKLKEECGVYGVIGVADAANFVALGLHALQHRGQEAGGIVSYHPDEGFNNARRFGYVRDNFTKQSLMETLPGALAIGHVRYSTAGGKAPVIRDVQPFFGEFAMGGAAIAHNGNITNANALRRELIERGSIFQSNSDSECIIHLMARSLQKTIPDRMEDALRRVEGAFSVVAMTRTKLIGVRDPLGVRPLVLGQIGDGWVLSSETCALDIIGARYVREIEPGEMVVITDEASKAAAPSARPVRVSASSNTSISRAPIRSMAVAPFTRPAARSAWSSRAKRRSRPISSARFPTAARPRPSATARKAASPTGWGSPATSIWAAPSSSRPSRSATWACGSS